MFPILRPTATFSPLVYGPILFYNPALLSSITKDGSNLTSQWNDLSNRTNNATQGTGASQFTWTGAAINNRPAMLGNGTSTSMNFASTITLSGEFTIFWAAQTASLAAGGGILGASPSTSKISISNASPTKFSIVVVNGGSIDATVNHPAVGVPYIGTLTRDVNNKVDLLINNGAANRLYTDVAQAGSMVLTRIGRDNIPLSFNGFIGTIIIYPFAMTATQRTQTAQYLSSVTGISI